MALFTCNISTTTWLKRIIFILFILLLCSTIKIIPIAIQTKIITKRVSSYIDLREELKVIKSGHEYYNLEKVQKTNFDMSSNDTSSQVNIEGSYVLKNVQSDTNNNVSALIVSEENQKKEKAP